MSADADKETVCPHVSVKDINIDSSQSEIVDDKCEKKCKKTERKVAFPDDDQLVTQYFEPANPWQDVPSTTRAQLAAEYLEACRRHATPPIDSVLQQIRELPETAIGGGNRAARLSLAECSLLGAAPADALEALLRKAQFRRLEIDHAALDDEGAEAIFDMLEYYESATVVCIIGPRQFGIRGWQAASRMIKKSAELTELEVSESPLEPAHAPVLARALRPHTCRLRALCLQRASLAGEPLLCLVIALKSNSSVRELRLGDNRLTAADASQLASLLRLNTRLQLLDLSNNQIQDAGAGHIADALVEQAAQTPPSAATSPMSPHQCPLMGGYEARGLAFLVLWNNQLTRNCANHLSKALRSSQSLCVLNIGRNALGTEAVRALQAGGALVSLGLQAARLGPDAARALADLIRADTGLQRLDLRDNRLGGAGLQAILAAMRENTTLTQIDLDEPTESASSLTAEDSEAATVARLTREIRALCRRNEPDASSPERRVHRKISLTCHTACLARGMQGMDEDRRGNIGGGGGSGGRLRSPAPSPAPSPAGSPVPAAHPHSRFSVTRVTPERESSTESSSRSTPTRPVHATPSRFKVVQVVEPPQIQVHSATTDQPRRTASRFSVTRNYDSMYNPIAPSPPPTPTPSSMKAKEKTADRKPESKISENPTPIKTVIPVMVTEPKCDVTKPKIGPSLTERIESDVCDIEKNLCDVKLDAKSEKGVIVTVASVKNDTTSVKNVEKVVKNDTDCIKSDKNAKQALVVNTDSVKNLSDNIKNTVTDSTKIDKTHGVKSERNVEKSLSYQDKSERLSHDESISKLGDDKMLKTETKFVKTSTEMSETEKIEVQCEVTVKKEYVQNITDITKVHSDQKMCSDKEDFKNIDDITINSEKRDNVAMKQIEAITEDLGNLIQEMRDMSTKTAVLTRKEVKVKNDCTQTEALDVNSAKIGNIYDVPVNFTRDNVVLKKNKSESSLDSPDLEVSRLMNKKLVGSPFCDSSSSLEVSGSSVESLNALDNQQSNQMRPIIIQESVVSDVELDRRKPDHITLSTESSIESNTSEITPVNSGNLLNTSVSSNESVSPIIFSITKKIHGSLSSLEASVSSLDSAKQEKVMVTSADSGIEYSLQHPSESKEDNSSNEGTLTNNSSLKETVKKPETFQLHDTLTSPKRTSSLLDVPALKNRGLDRMRKISWVAPSASFHIPKPEPEKVESKLPSHLEKLLSLFQHPSSLFSRSMSHEEEKKFASNTPPRKDSSLTSAFWSWGSTTEKMDKEDREDSSSEATDSTLSERVQVSFIDESFSKKLDSKTPSTDTDNTLSEFQSFPIQGNSETSDTSQTEIEKKDRVTDITTDDNLVQKSLVLSLKSMDNASSNGNKLLLGACDTIDLIKPNDLNKNVYDTQAGDSNKNPDKDPVTENAEKSDMKQIDVKLDDVKTEPVRPRSFAAVLKSSGSENSLDKQSSPETGHPVDKLPSKVIRGIKENISPENTLTSSMTNTKTITYELNERQVKNQAIVNTVWEVTIPLLDKNEPKTDDLKIQSDFAPIATIEETCDESIENAQLDFIDDIEVDNKNVTSDNSNTLEVKADELKKYDTKSTVLTEISELENVDLGKDALSYLIGENTNFESQITKPTTSIKAQQGSLAQELKEAEIKEQLVDLSPELVIDEAIEVPEVFTIKELKGIKTSPVIPERAKIKKSNSLEDISKRPTNIVKEPKTKTIAFKVPETPTTPRDIPERRTKLRTRSGSSPKSLPESLNKPCPLTKMDTIMSKKKKKVSSLGKMARDSLLALNMNEEEIAEFRKSYKLTSVESLRSLESVSEDANSQSGNSGDSRCRACLRTSQESLMSLDSITEDCRCVEECDRGPTHSAR